MKMKILTGDHVKILIGKDKGRTGEVIKSFPKTGKVVVKGLNLFKKHLKSSKDQKGGIIEKERSLLSSKVILLCPGCQKPVRVAYTIDKAGHKLRICRKCKTPLTQNKK
ncbi:50S ribosomal protein L24 [Candidatus Shapirobacteria bacterium CG06_land_8_20_14_3_00_40_12]|uniref:Large ribosomal subunit protein uL24 n=1 Tax=Candidatus Shapirobacteria bacterium CG06_land_8_20_14_3_00_40_12 TaxID=1974881 RepID=A0A2M7ASD3_9BACT|nr:MAG: 50S ribosomal protein L24 [Candidatus Shapirobacteria bacterium CG06_land_8_20_14_3_00_40_12]